MNIILAIPPSPDKKNIIRMIDCSHETKANYLWQPNDLMIITSLLEPADRVVFIDGTADRLSEEEYLRELKNENGDLVIFALSSVCWESDYAYFQTTRRQFPAVPFYVLGDIFLEENYQRHILAECDGIIFNPYSLDLPAMARRPGTSGTMTLPGVSIVPGQKRFPENKKAAAITSRTPRHELFFKKGYRFPFARHYVFSTVTTLWGCPFSCSYCTDSNFAPLVRTYQDVLQELDYLHGLGVRELFFADKVFGFSAQNVYPLLETMAERFRFSWSCYFHPQLYDPRLLDMMKAAGCHTIITGIDSADVPSLRRYRRVVNANKIDELIAHANRLNISICADFILGLEHETEKDIRKTIELALDLPIDFASFNIAAPLPGSDIRRTVLNAGRLLFGKEGFDTSGRSGILGNENIDAERLRVLRKMAFRKFYLRPSYLIKRLKKTTSVEHFMIQLQEMLTMIRKI